MKGRMTVNMKSRRMKEKRCRMLGRWGVLGGAVCLWMVSLPVGAAPPVKGGTGSCASVDFAPYHQNKVLKWTGPVVRVSRGWAPMFVNPQAGAKMADLAFNQTVEILEESGERLKVRSARFQDRASQTGWVHKADLLCRDLPIKGESGLETKFFIRTSTMAREEGKGDPTVRVFQDPELVECVGGKDHCREGASRFHMYYVMDQRDKSLLLADRYRLKEDDILVGWVNENNGFQWDNAFGLRPREEIKAPDGQGPGTVCTYERLEDAVARSAAACNPVEGSNKWFKSSLRIPVLDMVDAQGRHVEPGDLATPAREEGRRFFKVALARPGLVGRPVGDGKFAISPTLAQRIMPEFKSLSSKKNVDIFFVLDATASMDEAIDAVRGTATKPGVIQEIIHGLKNTPGFKETQFRFGFRVFRDNYADRLIPNSPGDGVGEGYPLPATCQLSPEQQTKTYEDFQKAIAQVKVTSDDQDDYEENVYGGLFQALKQDIQSCPDHLKLMFLIGDNGYRSGQLYVNGKGKRFERSKYRNPVETETLVALLRGGNKPGVKGNNILPFVIQTPSRSERTKHPELYNAAYAKFELQMRQILQQSLPGDSSDNEHFFRMGEEKLLSRLVGTVEKLGGSTLINEIILDIHGGAALNTVIERLRRERVDIPGVYWHILKQGACGDLGEQCERRVFDTTSVGYVEANDKVVEDLWVDSNALTSWIRILKGFEGYHELPEPQLRRALISALVLGMQQEMRLPPLEVSGETPAEYVQRRGGLPVRRHSPLLSYQVSALSVEKTLRDKDKRLIVADASGKPILDKAKRPIQAVTYCELKRLAMWAIHSRQMLEIIERGQQKPSFQVLPANKVQNCPDATDNGLAMPQVAGNVTGVPLGPDKNYRFGHELGGRRGYWIPQDYLP
ncbi:MAG: hypothetical protein H7833_08450 [Magnetococcus sp. DMHC-1]|nr:hypothetical protein [Magnetococcales bacterium]